MRDNQYSGTRTPVKPGQVWLIEHSLARLLLPSDRTALTSADVVIYDRALAPVAASVLSIGAYAEAVSLDASHPGRAISTRALGFALDGWSVAHLVEPHADRGARLRLAADALMSHGCAGDLPVLVIAKGTLFRHHAWDTCLRTLPGLEFADDDLLTLVFGPLVVRYPAPSHAFTANGLAG
jgi:siroheme synthase